MLLSLLARRLARLLDRRDHHHQQQQQSPVSFSAAEKKYSKGFWELREELDAAMKDDHLAAILTENNLYAPEKRRDIWLHLITNALLGGKTPKCPSCSNHSLLFYGEEYECAGYLSAVTRCPYKVATPHTHEEVRVPPEVASLKFFASWKPSSRLVKVGVAGGAGASAMEGEAAVVLWCEAVRMKEGETQREGRTHSHTLTL